MAGKTNQGNILKRADLLVDSLNGSELEPTVAELVGELTKARGDAKDALARRALSDSQSQQASRDLDAAVGSINVLYSRLRRIMQGVHGVRAEKLTEFGFQPLRLAQRSKAKEAPPVQAQSAKQAATAAADSTT
jgi:hypothetical protein